LDMVIRSLNTVQAGGISCFYLEVSAR
jgi:hypothetical protein